MVFSKIYLTFVLIVVSGITLFAQDVIRFKQEKAVEFGKVIYFGIVGITDDDVRESITKSFISDPNLKFISLGKNFEHIDWCQLEVKSNITPAYIQKKLNEFNLDFDFNSVVISEQRTDGMPPHYPVYIDTGNPKLDNAKYDQEKKEWMLKYPNEYKLLTDPGYKQVPSTKSNGDPNYIDTGNPVEDAARYDKLKKEWDKSQSENGNIQSVKPGK